MVREHCTKTQNGTQVKKFGNHCCIRLLLLHVSKITHIYFSFFSRAIKCLFIFLLMVARWSVYQSRRLFFVYCFYSCDVRSDLVYIDMCRDLVFGDVCSILLPTMRSEIFCSLSWLIVVADGRVLVICDNLFHRWTSRRTDVIMIVCHN